MNDDDEEPFWVTCVKLFLIAVAIVGGVGLSLWYAEYLGLGGELITAPQDSWGITNDSPLRDR